VAGEGVNPGNDLSGAGDTSGGNAAGEAGAATDVGTGSDGAQGSGGSNEAGGTTAPDSDTGAPVQGDDTGNAESGTGADTGDAGALAYSAVAEAECAEVQEQLTAVLGVEVSRAAGVAAFQDLTGNVGESCQLTATGTGVEFGSMANATGSIGELFTTNGWTADPQYAADSPTSAVAGLRRDNQLAVYRVEWMPGPAVTCPADQPIAVCVEGLTPDQITYNITVDLVQQ
jgi:hypothetical protein